MDWIEDPEGKPMGEIRDGSVYRAGQRVGRVHSAGGGEVFDLGGWEVGEVDRLGTVTNRDQKTVGRVSGTDVYKAGEPDRLVGRVSASTRPRYITDISDAHKAGAALLLLLLPLERRPSIVHRSMDAIPRAAEVPRPVPRPQPPVIQRRTQPRTPPPRPITRRRRRVVHWLRTWRRALIIGLVVVAVAVVGVVRWVTYVDPDAISYCCSGHPVTSFNGTYVVGRNDVGTVVVDTRTNTVLDYRPERRLSAIRADGRIGYEVRNSEVNLRSGRPDPNEIRVIEIADDKVVDTIAFPLAIQAMALSPDGDELYVATGHRLSVLDTSENKIDKSVLVSTEGIETVSDLVFAPDGKTLYLALSFSGALVAVNTDAMAVVAKIPVSGGLSGMAPAPDGRRVYVSNDVSNTVTIVDVANQAVVARIPVGSGPTGLAVQRSGRLAYVVNHTDGSISIIDLGSSAVVRTIDLDVAPLEVATGRSGDSAYIFTDGPDYGVLLVDAEADPAVSSLR